MNKRVYDKLKQAQKTVQKFAQDVVEQDPRLSAKVETIRHKYDALRKEVETRFDQIEEELWAWISTKQREAQRYQTHFERVKNAERFYRILGVKKGASREEIKQAWREKMKAHHPDRFAQDPKAEKDAAEQARQINLAYQELIEIVTFMQSSR